jgi:hypothetical protein
VKPAQGVKSLGGRSPAPGGGGGREIREARGQQRDWPDDSRQDYLGPDHRVTNMERFFTALMQALHDAYALGWKDRGEVTREPD